MLRILLCCTFTACLSLANAQVNAYARVSSVSGEVLHLAGVNESFSFFEPGTEVVIMQMQDDVIGSNTANNASFGDLDNIRSAGLYEVRAIVSVTRVGDELQSITLDAPLANGFNFNDNGRVQVISFELLGDGNDYTTVENLAALPWNGEHGGVVAIQVQGTLTLAHNIHADARGFRGGDATQTMTGSCDLTTFRSAAAGQFAFKGEGIYRATDATYAAARGKILNGGGGGNEHNGGGGGGGNYSAGGNAGPGWNCGAGNAGGLAGISLSGLIGAERVYMGGGGGGGEGNDNLATAGGNGGGIVLIKAHRIRTTGTCAERRISANGASAAQSGNDGAGGGGAGGAVVLDVVHFELDAGCPLAVQANGGDGGRVNSALLHGAGGGGGQGVVIFTGNMPNGNATVTTLNGSGGCNNNDVPCTDQAGSGQGAANSGILYNTSTPLPVELLSFQAIPVRNRVLLLWATASENGNREFVVERSTDLELWQPVERMPGMGTTHQVTNYHTTDHHPLPRVSYYRLRQEDHDGQRSWSNVVSVMMGERITDLEVFPNPAADRVSVLFSEAMDGGQLLVLNDLGQRMGLARMVAGGRADIDVQGLAPGLYTVVLNHGDTVLRARLAVQR